MESAKIARLVVKFLMLMTVISGLTGCGANFVRGGMDPLKGNEKVGVLVIRHEVFTQRLLQYVNISDKLNDVAAAKVGIELRDLLAKNGFNPVMLPASDKVAIFVKKYKDLPRSGRKVVSDPQAADFGDLSDLFKEYGVDQILVYEGESLARKGALGSFVSAAAATAAGLVLNSIISTGPAKGFTVTYLGIVYPNGKFSYYNREQFSKRGDFLSTTERQELLEAVIHGWTASQK